MHKGCGDASMRKRHAQATSVKHSGRESGNQNKGTLSSPWGICACRVAVLQTSAEKKKKKRENNREIAHTIPQDDHITPHMNEAFVSMWDPCAYGRTHGWL
ncbi:hypothetical protein VZT92_017981 [Zoarces viviparus]|uniref:Uncharacterized protein n=1 Tax=Zoarces viviparus TaxID=48416 RepID=A0AAW1EQB7_ZOAVI